MSQSILHLPPKSVHSYFLKYVCDFGETHKLWPEKLWQQSFIALSGGADSMLLTYCVYHIFKKRGLMLPVALHVNYGTRNSSDAEEELCKKFCDSLGIKIHILKLESVLTLRASNFESEARDIRYKFFKKFLIEPCDLLYMGHHLDDCYEWSLMMSLKSSHLKSRLGTPIRNLHIRRPFHCLGKQQIKNLCEKLSIPYANDNSNEMEKFERNKIRFLVAGLKKSYPSLLKNYVASQRELWELYQLKKTMAPKVDYCRYGGAIVSFEDLSQISNSDLKKIISEFIYKFSQKNRGRIRDQLEALLSGWQNQTTGPYFFSGDVLVYPIPNGFYILSKKIQEKWEQSLF